MSAITTYYLEMMSSDSLNEKTDPKGATVLECKIKQFQFNKFLYQLVGSNWNWTDKLSWSDEQWKAFAEVDTLRTWVAYVKGSPAGYFELQQQKNKHVEIAYFGLAPKFIGQGVGGYLLSQAVKAAWAWDGTTRVWVHTCTLDHPNALQNYQSRGFEIYQEETTTTP